MTAASRAALLLSASLAAFAPVVAHAQLGDEDARIARLEAAVAALQAQVKAQGDVAAENAALKHEVADLRSKLQEKPPATEAPRTTAVAIGNIPAPRTAGNATPAQTTFNNNEPGIASTDGRFSLNLYALVQLDAADYLQAGAGPISTDLRRTGPAVGYTSSNVDFAHARNLKSGTDFRRARFGFSGKAFGDFSYRILADFGGSGVENAGQLYEAWGEYAGLKPFHLRVGAFAPQEGLADQDSTAAQPLMERPASADVARNFAGGDSRTAVQLFIPAKRFMASAAVTGKTIGVISSSGAAVNQTYGDQLGFVARVAGTPFEGDGWRVHLGVHGQAISHPADTTGPGNNLVNPATRYTIGLSDQAELRVDGTKLINTGNIDAKRGFEVGTEAAIQYKNLLLQSEWDHFDITRVQKLQNPRFDGWYVEGSWVITGEARKYNTGTAAFDAPPVRNALGKGGFGAVELAARYSQMDLNFDPGAPGSAPAPDAVRGGKLKIWSAALNWYPNPFFRLAVEGQHVELERLSPDAAAFVTPIGAQIGQRYDTIALRSQVGF